MHSFKTPQYVFWLIFVQRRQSVEPVLEKRDQRPVTVSVGSTVAQIERYRTLMLLRTNRQQELRNLEDNQLGAS